MMNQYKNETAQVHAPKALIEKTKVAVREEEARIQRGQSRQISAAAPQAAYADYAVYQKKYSWRKWSYPLTAAAAVVILLSVSMVMKSVLPGESARDGFHADTAAGTAPAPAADEACAEEMTEEKASDAPAAGAVEEMNSGQADSMPEESIDSMTEAEAMAGDEGVISEAPAADFAKEDTEDAVTRGEATEKTAKKFRDLKHDRVQIEAVDEKPDFYDDPDAEDVIHEELTFRVIKEKEEWAAYVETEDGSAYIIRGEAEDLSDFLKKAYAGLENR